MTKFAFTKTSSPDFSGSDFYVRHDREFDEEEQEFYNYWRSAMGY